MIIVRKEENTVLCSIMIVEDIGGRDRVRMNNQNPVNDFREDPIQREIEKLDATNRKLEEKVRNLETRAIQNLNLYFVFQAVILASTTMASAPNCRQLWIPLVVSLLAAIPNFFNFCTTMFKVLKEREELDQNLVDVAFIKLKRMSRAQIDQVLPGAVLINQLGDEIVRPKPSSARRWKRRLQVYASLALFLGFTAVILSGCYTILCRSDDDRKCVKLC